MMKKIIFLEDEQEILNEVLAKEFKFLRRTITLEYVISKWERFINRICIDLEYYTLETYTNRLSLRDTFNKIILAGCKNADFISLVEELDKEFKDNTNEINKPLRPSKHNEGLGWWWYRVPKKMSKEFEETLDYFGYKISNSFLDEN